MAAKKSTDAAPFSLNMRGVFAEAPPFRPAINLGCLLDIPTGRYERGYDGHFYCTGGLNPTTGVGGRGNMFKSAIQNTMMMIALSRVLPYGNAQSRDCEFTQTLARFEELSCHIPGLQDVDLATAEFFLLTSQGETSGNAWFSQLQDYFEAKRAAAKQFTYTTPFVDMRGNSLKMLAPTIVGLDSMSQFTTDVTTKILDENEVGDSSAQTVFMRGAGAKYQMFMQIPSLMASSGGYFLTTAHMDEEIKMETYAPDTRKLAFMKMGLKFKNVPNNFHTLTNNLWMVLKVTPLHDKDKKPYFPRDEKDNQEGDTDLMTLTLWNLRGKQGPSGLPFELVLSQREGILVPVTEYLYLKAHGHYGVTEAGRTMELDLYPGVTFDRKTLRSLVYKDPKMVRAIEITSEMCQIKFMKPEHHDVLVRPKELRKKLDELGYDWEKLLDTRNFWVFKEAEAMHKPFLSTLDLLTMAAGSEDHPWYAQFKK
jgi:hypothetical protein